MKHLLRDLFSNSRLFTLIEIGMSMGLSALIIVVLVMSVGQLFKVSASADSRVTVVRNLDTAGSWLAQDFEQGQPPLPSSMTLSPGAKILTITQSCNAPSDTVVTYAINANGQLQRTVHNTTSVVASDISPIAYSAGPPGKVQIT